MQIAPSISLVLTDPSSFKRFADLRRETSQGGFYQQVASELVKGACGKEIFRELGDRLVGLAEHVHAFRQMDTLEQVSEILISLPLPHQYEAVGLYYQAACIRNLGRGDVNRAVSMLESIANSAPARYRARAIISLAASAHVQRDSQSALSLYSEAGRFAWRSGLYDPYVIIHSQKMIAVINSEDGNHRGALALLENLFPLAHAGRSLQPHVYYDYLNSLAVELCEVGRLEEAKNVSQIVLASPFAHAYPEWRETSNEIALRGRGPSRATVAFSQRISESKDLGSIRWRRAGDEAISPRIPEAKAGVRLLVPRRGEGVAEWAPASEPARVLSLEEWKKGMAEKSHDATKDREVLEGMKHTKEQIREMTTSQKLVRLMNLISSELTDDQMGRILSSVEDIALEKHAKS